MFKLRVKFKSFKLGLVKFYIFKVVFILYVSYYGRKFISYYKTLKVDGKKLYDVILLNIILNLSNTKQC